MKRSDNIFKLIAINLVIVICALCALSLDSKANDKIPIEIDHYGKDTYGIRIAYELKEIIKSSKIYRLTIVDEPRIVIDINSVDEFTNKPNSASIYSVVWISYNKYEKGFLKIYLTNAISACRENKQVKESAEEIIATTDKVVTKHFNQFIK